MSAVEVFQFPATGQQVRTVVRDGEPWFAAKDACDVIGISKHRDAVARLDADERASMAVDTLGGRQSMTVVNEPGLYALMMISRSEKVRPFRRWVTHDVLPAIRRTGRYEVGSRHEIPQTYAAALRLAADEHERAERAQRELEAAAPKAEAWDVLASAHGDYAVREAAYILNRDPAITTGQNRLFTLLRDWGLIDRFDRPYASHARHVRLRPQTRPNRMTGEEITAKPQVRITAEGLRYIHRRLGGTSALESAS